MGDVTVRKPDTCKGCPWYEKSTGFLPPMGEGDVCFISDYPDLGDVFTHKHLSYGRAGDMMRRALPKPAYEYSYASMVQCTPRFKVKESGHTDLSKAPGWEEAAVFCRQAHLKPFIEGKRGLIPLGAKALGFVVGKATTDRSRGYLYKDALFGIPTIGTYHPAMVGEGNTGLLFTMKYDLRTFDYKTGPEFGKMPYHPILDPTPQAFGLWVDELCSQSSWVVVDIETPWSDEDESEYSKKQMSFEILRLSFCGSHDPTTAVTIPFTHAYKAGIRKLMASGLSIVYWNGDFDDPRLSFNGFPRKGKFVDAMWLWHFLQPDLPRNLAHVSTYFTELPEWKSTSQSDPIEYSAYDAYAEAQCYIAIMRDLEKHGMKEIADRHVTDVLDLLRDVNKRGIQTDPAALAAVRERTGQMVAEWEAKFNLMYPDEIKKTKWYKGVPPGVKKGAVYDGAEKVIAGKAGRYIKDGEKWGFRWNFNPSSSDQIKDYLVFKGIKVPRKHKTQKETTDHKALTRIFAQTHDPLLKELLEFAKVIKVYSTYTNWPIDELNRVHPNFSLVPATGRLSCERPNFQNIPKEGEWADLIRSCIVASEGCELIAADYVGMESYLTGYFAGDPVYMDLATMNIYAYVVAKYKKWDLPVDPSDLRVKLVEYKKKAKSITEKGETRNLYDKFKAIVLGIGYGEGRDTLFYGNPGLFKDLSEAGRLREFVLNTFPKVKEWQVATVKQAGHDKRLYNPWHYVRWFHDCPGSDSARAMAQQPQSTGAAIVKESMLQLADTWLRNCLVLQIHDELVFDVPKERVVEATNLIKQVMMQGWEQLEGHSIAVSVKHGKNLRDMEDF